ncbi:Rib/alpha-like domain-containing protein [Staphylococcus aureus]|uniref:Rib/alpha-like domain-containing protein n=1 Tax=Staphylococcus aureus TaxID=1280 RepID=UPI001EFF42E4|nr:Rib/alpha-like domain-containing protein [Staphylococcus aureus]
MTVPGYPTDAAKQPTFKVTDPSTLPDGKTAGKTDVSVTVTYPDGTTEEVTVPVTVGEQPENEKTIWRSQKKKYQNINKNNRLKSRESKNIKTTKSSRPR